MELNAFFSTSVRIQSDRGHTVTTQGPYQLVRHQGYAGLLVYNLMIPLVLCSWWTFLPALFTIVLICIRTALEDRTLQLELPDYHEYAGKVRYRLIPGIW